MGTIKKIKLIVTDFIRIFNMSIMNYKGLDYLLTSANSWVPCSSNASSSSLGDANPKEDDNLNGYLSCGCYICVKFNADNLNKRGNKCGISSSTCSHDEHQESRKKVVCGKSFTQAHGGILKGHKMIHNGKKSFKCSVCEKSFGVPSALKKHERTHTGEKPLVCSVCGKCFSVSAHLKRHQKIHTGEKPYKCTLCGKCFRHNCTLKRHQEFHSGVKPFKCLVCGKCFTQKGDLRNHGRIHTGEKPFKCSLCGKCFARSS